MDVSDDAFTSAACIRRFQNELLLTAWRKTQEIKKGSHEWNEDEHHDGLGILGVSSAMDTMIEMWNSIGQI